jgi:hypothetical protein
LPPLFFSFFFEFLSFVLPFYALLSCILHQRRRLGLLSQLSSLFYWVELCVMFSHCLRRSYGPCSQRIVFGPFRIFFFCCPWFYGSIACSVSTIGPGCAESSDQSSEGLFDDGCITKLPWLIQGGLLEVNFYGIHLVARWTRAGLVSLFFSCGKVIWGLS